MYEEEPVIDLQYFTRYYRWDEGQDVNWQEQSLCHEYKYRYPLC